MQEIYLQIYIIIIAYLLGSIPFGYFFSEISGKKILEIGWRKTSGSNVFKNVGKWQGTLTGIFDVGKGFLAIWLAQKLGLSLEVQVFSGVAAVIGHNWSCFLKFAGGRGIGTFMGALLALSPKILGFSLIPFALLALIWNAAIGTFLLFITIILLSIYFNQFETAGMVSLLSIIPVWIKRLSPLKELKKVQGRANLIKNRLIFDSDQTCFNLRIKRIFRRLKNLT